MTWEPIWALPNIDLDESVNSETFALVSPADPRVQELVQQHRNFGTFLNQFNPDHSDENYKDSAGDGKQEKPDLSKIKQ